MCLAQVFVGFIGHNISLNSEKLFINSDVAPNCVLVCPAALFKDLSGCIDRLASKFIVEFSTS